jgi:hypothetical protein
VKSHPESLEHFTRPPDVPDEACRVQHERSLTTPFTISGVLPVSMHALHCVPAVTLQ